MAAKIQALLLVLGALAAAAFNGATPRGPEAVDSRGVGCPAAAPPRTNGNSGRAAAIAAGGIVGPVRIDPRVDIGHVHLKVSNLDRALAFYRDLLGFDVTQRLGDEAAFLSAGGYHHHIALNTWESRGGSPPPPNTTGLYHVAIRYPDRRTLGGALRRLIEAKWPITGATDHGVSEAIYLRDPDGSGIELYRDRPEEEWPRPEAGEGVVMYSHPLDLRALLAEAG